MQYECIIIIQKYKVHKKKKKKETKSLAILPFASTKLPSYSHRSLPKSQCAGTRDTQPKIGHRCSLSHDMQHNADLESSLFLSFPVQIPSTWLGVRLLLLRLLRGGNRPRLLQLAHDNHPVLVLTATHSDHYTRPFQLDGRCDDILR